MNNPYPNYQAGMVNGANGAFHPQPAGNGQYAGYGSVSYPNNSAMADIQSMDTRRRAIEALNDFLGDIKRRAIDPASYYDVGHRLQGNALPLPVQSGAGYNTGYNNSGYTGGNFTAASLLESFNHGGSMGGGGGGQGGVATQGYSLPLPNARTKNDLQDIDRFLEQLQATVYETSKGYESGSHAAAAGIQQPGLHTQFAGEFGLGNGGQYRSSNSPPNFQNHLSSGGLGVGALSSGSSMHNVTSSASALDTPALTPSSVSSYTSAGHSPMSSHSRASFGSVSGHNMYPSLPAVTGMSDIGSNYPTTTSAPASGLTSGFEMERRYSGGRLQRQAPQQDTEMADVEDDGSRTPKQSDAQRPSSKGNSSIDPALRGEDAGSDSASTPAAEVDDKRQEEWIENIRLIEALRKWVGERLKVGDYDSQEGEMDGQAQEGAVDMDSRTAETAKMVAEKLRGALNEANKQEAAAAAAANDVNYPSLSSA